MEGINFKNVQGVQSPKVQQNKGVSEQQVKEKDHSCAKVVLGGLAALAAIGAAAVLIKNGQASKLAKEMNTEQFKKAGCKFVKGKAFTKSGKAFSGTLRHFKKDGTQVILKYEDGLLRTSEKMLGDVSKSQKIYGYNNVDKLTSIQNTKGYKIFEKKQIGSIVRIKLKDGKKYIVSDKASGEMLIDNGCNNYYKNGKKLYSNYGYGTYTAYGENGQKLITRDGTSFLIHDAKGNKLCGEESRDFVKYNLDGSERSRTATRYAGGDYLEAKAMVEKADNELHQFGNRLLPWK